MQNEIIEYIEQAKKSGLNPVEIKQNLLNAGWEAAIVEESFVHAKAAENKEILPKYEEKQNIQAGFQTPILSQNDLLTAQVQNQQLSEGSIALSTSVSTPNSRAKKITLTALLILAGLGLLGGGGYAAYAYYFNNSSLILLKMAAAPGPKVYSTLYKISYSDKSLPDSVNQTVLNLEGSGYTDLSDASLGKTSSELKISASSGGETTDKNIKFYIFKDVLYLNLGEIKEINQLAGKPVDWIKLDLKALTEMSSSTKAGNSDILTDQSKFSEIAKNILEKNNFIVFDKKPLRETLDETAVYRLYLKIDKEKLKIFLNQLLDEMEKRSGESPAYAGMENMLKESKKNSAEIIDKLEIKQFELWIASKDYSLRRILFVSNAPTANNSFSQFSGSFLGSSNAEAKGRDAARVSDVQKLGGGLRSYFNQKGGFPEGLNGIPVGLDGNFIAKIPASPEPADGNCTEYYNTYWYQPTGTPKNENGINLYPDYQYTFCLGGNTDEYSSGITQMTSAGTGNLKDCPSSDLKKCYKNSPPAEQSASNGAANFSAQFTLDYKYFDINKKKELAEPRDAWDVMEIVKSLKKQSGGN